MDYNAGITHAIREQRFDGRQAAGEHDRDIYAPAREARERAAEINSPGVIHDPPALPVFHAAPPLQVIHPPADPPRKASKQTAHQMRSSLLSMHATADQYRTYGRGADLKRQLAKIADREATLRAAAPEMWQTYQADRDAERRARQIAPPEPPPPPAPADPRSDLDRAVEALVAAHTCSAVLDATWAAAHRLFRPNGARP
jgi:hypothetical protein